MKQKTAILGTELVVVGKASLQKAERKVTACQHCSRSATRPFISVLCEVLGTTRLFSDYVLGEPAHCPSCSKAIMEDTLVRCIGDKSPTEASVLKDLPPLWDDTAIVLVGENIVAEAEESLAGCENCVEGLEMTFDYLLDAVTYSDPAVTEYLMCRPARCPCCFHEVTEKTFVVGQ